MTFIVLISFQEPRSDGEVYKKGKRTLTLFEIAMHLIECISGHTVSLKRVTITHFKDETVKQTCSLFIGFFSVMPIYCCSSGTGLKLLSKKKRPLAGLTRMKVATSS